MIVFDSLPYLGVLVNNALVAADELIIPVQAEPLGIAGAAMMLTHLQKVRDDGMIGRPVIRDGLMTIVDRRTAINTQSIDYAHQMLGSHIPFFAAEIERTVRVAETQLMKQSVLTYRPREVARCLHCWVWPGDTALVAPLHTTICTGALLLVVGVWACYAS